MPTLLVVGGLGVDTIVRVPAWPLTDAQTTLVPPALDGVGHTGNGVAMGGRALGLGAVVVDVIGDDPAGALVRSHCTAYGIELDALVHPSGTRRSINLMDPGGVRHALYDPRHPADLRVDPQLWRRHLTTADWVHVSIMGWAADALADATSTGRPTSTDLHDWDGTSAHHLPFALGADHVFVSADRLPDETGVAERVLSDGRAQTVVAMDGARGSRLHRRGQPVLELPAVTLPDRPPVDANGAGDAYAAGWIAATLAGLGPEEACRWGSVAGAWTCGSAGTHTSFVGRDELARVLGEGRTVQGL